MLVRSEASTRSRSFDFDFRVAILVFAAAECVSLNQRIGAEIKLLDRPLFSFQQ